MRERGPCGSVVWRRLRRRLVAGHGGRAVQTLGEAGQTLLEIELPNASLEEVDVVARGDELLVRVRDAHRRIALPASVAGRPVAGVRLAKQVLEVAFGS